MTSGGIRFLPERLPAIPDGWNAWLRPLWFVALALAVFLDIAGTVYVMRDAYERDPAFSRLSLSSTIENDGSVSVESVVHPDGRPRRVPEGSRIEAIDGERVAPRMRVWDLAERLQRPDGAQVTLEVATPDGQMVGYIATASSRPALEAEQATPISRDVRIAARIAISLITCMALIACAVMLYIRRPRDPVAYLFSMSFLLFAGTIDPPLIMWLAYGAGDLFDLYAALAWVLLVVGIAAFPDGVFTPRWVRFIIVLAPLLAIPLMIDSFPLALGAFIAFIGPLFLLMSHWIKYRRFPAGIERQQVKWAAFGFATGLVMIGAAFFLTAMLETSDPRFPIWGLVVLVLFQLGFLMMVLGLFVSLIRFRLWEADRVISKSAVTGLVTLAVGIIWTLSMDLVKRTVEFTLGEENETIATAAGAVLAAGIFGPTQALALKWTRRRFGREQDRVKTLIARLAVWRSSEAPDEIAQRTLSALASALHASRSAILVETPRGAALLASRDLDEPEALAAPGARPEEDPRFALTFPLEDEDGPVGQLLIGPRSDLNRYNADEIRAFGMLLEPLAETLRTAHKRSAEAASMQKMLGSVEERLARLERGDGQLGTT
jgi:hypothetical protein